MIIKLELGIYLIKLILNLFQKKKKFLLTLKKNQKLKIHLYQRILKIIQ